MTRQRYKTLLLLGLLCFPLSIMAQDPYEEVLHEVEKNNPILNRLQQEAEAEKSAHRSELNLENPEMGYNHLWATPRHEGKRHDFSISQSFDFPTAYAIRSKMLRLEYQSIDLKLTAEKRRILLVVTELCAQLIYENAIAEYDKERLKQAITIAESHKKQLANGEISLITYNKAMINLATTEQEMTNNELRREKIMNELQFHNGGEALIFTTDRFPARSLSQPFDEWQATLTANNPHLLEQQKKVEIGHRAIALNKAMGLPKLSAGYMREQTHHETFSGVSLGITIPLWENRHKVKQARQAWRAAQLTGEEETMRYYTDLKNSYQEAEKLLQVVNRYRALEQEQNNLVLLKKAFDAGEISLLEYLMEIEYDYQAVNKSLEAQRDLELVLAKIHSNI